MPLILRFAVAVPNLIIGGTSVLIVVSVVLEVKRQLLAHLSMRRYDNV